MGEIKESAHTKWRCEYHIVFAPKYRRKEIYGKLKADIGQILRKLCEEKKVEILEAQACSDHIHMLVSVPPHLSIAQFMGYLKDVYKRQMCYELNAFAQMIYKEQSPKKWNHWTELELELMDEARKQVGIFFPADSNRQ